MTMVPVTTELLEDTAGGMAIEQILQHRLHLWLRHQAAHFQITQWLHDQYGTWVPYPPQPFDAEALRPPLPRWPRPHR